MTTVAVTGASGFLGRAICRHLTAGGFAVRALVRQPGQFRAAGVEIGACDLPATLDEDLFAGADAVVHCAWATRATDVDAARRVNEEGTRRVLDATRRHGAGRVVFVSSIAARADAPSYYGRSKDAIERLLDPARDLALRPGLVLGRDGHGLFQQLLDSMRRLRVVPLFDGGCQPVQTAHVDDVCEAVRRGIDLQLTGTVAVAEPEPVPMRELLRMMAAGLGIRCLFVPVPFAPALAALRAESLLGLAGMRRVETAADLARLGMRVRTARESLAELLATPKGRGPEPGEGP